MSIAEANVSIEELEEAIRRENDRRYAFYRMMRATDAVLWRLEEFNRDGIRTVPTEWRERFREALAELPAAAMDAYQDHGRVQETLDSVFEVQDRLFRWRDPERPADEDYEGEVAG